MLCPGPSGAKGGEEGIEQSDVEVIVLKKKGKELLNEPISKVKANEPLNSLSTTSTALSSSYINYQLRFPCCH